MISTETLIIFSRYPEAGKTKTRTIPALGPEGAANLQREMSEYTVSQALSLQSLRPVSIEIHYAGGNEDLMRQWLGEDLNYFQQVEGDLGEKMFSAFQGAFEKGMEKVITIGIDCPGVTSVLLAEAFEALEQNDLVLGPAADGGYYLIGLSCLVSDLFKGIPWSTSEVFSKTKGLADDLGLKVKDLVLLNDVDRPEDLEIWEKVKEKIKEKKTSNEEKHWHYLETRPHPWRKQLYVKGRKLKAFGVWMDAIVNEMTPTEAAEEWDLPLAAISEIFEYCETHQELLKYEADLESHYLKERGIDLEPKVTYR